MLALRQRQGPPCGRLRFGGNQVRLPPTARQAEEGDLGVFTEVRDVIDVGPQPKPFIIAACGARCIDDLLHSPPPPVALWADGLGCVFDASDALDTRGQDQNARVRELQQPAAHVVFDEE